MTDEEFFALQQEARTLAKGSRSAAVELLEKRAAKCLEEFRQIQLLLGEYYEPEKDIEKIEIARRFAVQHWPEEVLAWTALTEFLIFAKVDLEDAERVARKALSVANGCGDYVRLCYINLARISRLKNNYESLENCLKALVQYKPLAGSQDVNFENDFLIDIDQTKIDSSLLTEYNSLV